MSEPLTIKELMTLQAADVDHHRVSWYTREGYLRDLFGEAPTFFYARLDRLIDDPRAVAEYPVLCSRLRRLREARKAARRGESVSTYVSQPGRAV